ncbi:MAG: UbiA family prenyltransferase, partial [Lutimaribacter sp.]
GRVALVTAANQAWAEQIAAHVQLFDEVHGSDAVTNLKGQAKAAFLCQRFGEGRFAYMGDAVADLPVWAVAGQVVTVNAPARLRTRAEGLGKPTVHLRAAAGGGWPYFSALRPHQWLKNVLVFLPMLASHQLGLATVVHSFWAFVAFSLVASSVYVLNDLLDLGADRAHPRKRLRPFAAGAVPLAQGAAMAVGLAFAGAAVAAYLGPAFALVLGIYYVLTTAYSLALKRQIVLDICVLAGLYTMRLIAGAVASGIDLSVWLLAFCTFFFFALAAVKRQAELVDMAARGRGYHVQDLPIISMVGLAAGYISVLVMALYVNAPAVQELYANPYALWGICAVLLYWLTRIVLLTHRGAMPMRAPSSTRSA